MNKYEDNKFINKYIGLWAYGYVNKYCGTEGVYRIIENFIIKEFKQNEKIHVLDIGCGVGRTTCDIAKFFNKAKVDAIDNSVLSIKAAKKILKNKTHKNIQIDLSDAGFNQLSVPTYDFPNVNLIQDDFKQKTYKNEYDLIVAVNMLDRCSSLENFIEQIYGALKPNGIFIGSMPFNFTSKLQWETTPNSKELELVLRNRGFTISHYLKGVPYRELLDANGAYNEFYVDAFSAQKGDFI
ncbi:MAG: class I SAM-dependent methyltransferase [Acidaminococcaceae bacterium]|jgi:SAM-dependent methyltransferase|nr:class I SAM-dependent methyltransferase [Acidaminococcaceae bacterium]MCI2110272.1 class I SAM-dependent methyltransferase [Acidaminococcaceae bacterium]